MLRTIERDGLHPAAPALGQGKWLSLIDPLERLAIRILSVARVEEALARRIYRFLVVGVGTTAIYLASMLALVRFAGVSATAGAVTAFFIGGASSYVGNTLWGFGSKISARTGFRFALVTALGLGLNAGIAWGMEHLRFHYVAIGVVTAVAIPTYNFIAHSLFTYRAHPSDRAG
jgi:putative flippase GtrA